MKKRGQAWSIELIASLSVFIVIIIAVFVSLGSNSENPVQELQTKSQQFIGRFYSTESSEQQAYSFIDDNTIDTTKLGQLSTLDYATLKAQLGLSDDFCIILVDTDNNIIPIQGDNNRTYYGIGSNNIKVASNVACNATVS